MPLSLLLLAAFRLGGHGDDLMDDGDTGGSRLPLTVDVSVSEAGTGPISHIQVRRCCC